VYCNTRRNFTPPNTSVSRHSPGIDGVCVLRSLRFWNNWKCCNRRRTNVNRGNVI